MKSRTEKPFYALLRALPKDVQQDAKNAYRQFAADHTYPGLRFKKLAKGGLYSVRIGRDYRAVGRMENGDTIIWFWIGKHTDYDKLLK